MSRAGGLFIDGCRGEERGEEEENGGVGCCRNVDGDWIDGEESDCEGKGESYAWVV